MLDLFFPEVKTFNIRKWPLMSHLFKWGDLLRMTTVGSESELFMMEVNVVLVIVVWTYDYS